MIGLLKKLFLLILLVVGIGFFVLPQSIFAQSNFSTGNTVTLPRDTIINEDYFVSGGTVVISGTVNGDVFVAGGNVLINGTVAGDVLSAGGNVTVNGKVGGNVRVVGGQVLIGADVGKNVTAAGGTITIEDSAKIAGSLSAAGGNISLLSPIGKGVTFAGTQMSIDGAIGGNVTGVAQTLSITRQSSIAGSLNYWSNTKANLPSDVAVKGVTYHQTNWNTPQQKEQMEKARNGFVGFNVVWETMSLISSFVIGWLLLWLVPLYMKSVNTTLTTKPWQSLGIGFLAVILMPITFIILLATIIGISFAFILLFGFVLFMLLNKIFISYAIGKKLLPDKNLLGLFVGLIIFSIISIIPFIGGLWNLAALFVGLGAILLVKKDLYLQARAKKLI
ncbi:MAG TPA: hypothetical protein VFQ63_02145 [Patescibacteria group bacterium]|nr:hypothetical protein [Patescibacteria group bacterium]